jgi:hypothetical protein
VPDGAAYTDLKLDPWVIRYPNGDLACYIGAAPYMGNPAPPKVIAAWARASASTGGGAAPAALELELVREPIAPNPCSGAATIRFAAPGGPGPRRVRRRGAAGGVDPRRRAAHGRAVRGALPGARAPEWRLHFVRLEGERDASRRMVLLRE